MPFWDRYFSDPKNHIKFGYYSPQEKEKAESFNKYLREQKKIIIDIDRVIECNKYKLTFMKTYFNLLITQPKRFVIYKTAFGWTSDSCVVQECQMENNPRFFRCYFHSLFTNYKTEKCEKMGCSQTGIHVYCNHCVSQFCEDCFVGFRDCYIPYNNWFKCPNCRELNILR